MSERAEDIAIIGMSATFAGADDLGSYWQNIVDKVDAVSEADEAWSSPFYDPDSKDATRIYTRKGGFLKELAEFNPLEFGIMPNAVDGGEPDQYLALKLASQALQDAGYRDRPFERSRAGVILGRGTYVNRGYTTLMQHGLIIDQTLALLRSIDSDLSEDVIEQLRGGLREQLPPFTAEMCPGLVPNLVTGRIANRLDLMGPNFIIDAACASSLIAIELAIRELHSGRCDMMLTGGVHASTPPQIYMIFCQLNALSRSNIRPFDEAADGVLLGEGIGILTLKRLSDAERDGDRIYALIKGVGTSSDGKALGMLAPRLEGEVLALERAYGAAEVDPQSVELIEAHGTGIALGDQTEIESLSTIFGKRGEHLPRVAIGSVKSMISHCIPAAGAAGTIKTALALYHKILPPTLCERVNPNLGIEDTPFYVNNEARPWIRGASKGPRRAGVNSFGFGGINAHLVLEEYCGPSAPFAPALHTRWPNELFLFAAESAPQLVHAIDRVVALAEANPSASLAQLALSVSGDSGDGHFRLAVIASSRDELNRKLHSAKQKIESDPKRGFQTRSGTFYAATQTSGKVAFLFPGEGSQYNDMLADICQYFPSVREWFDFLDDTFAEERQVAPSTFIFPPPTSLSAAERARAEAGLYEMDLGSEAVFTASMAMCELLGAFGITCDTMVGHSTGENTALIASGVVAVTDRTELGEKMRRFNRIYRELQKTERIPRGALMTVGAIERARIDAVMTRHGDALHVAMDNCPNQVVLFGSPEAIEDASRELSGAGALCAPLPFDRAYHTSVFEGVADAFMTFYRTVEMGPGHTPVFSCTALEHFPESADRMRVMAARQWSNQVRFREAIEKLYEDGFRTFVEVGPSSNLTSFVRDILRSRDHLAAASDSRRRPGLATLQELLARVFVRGGTLDTRPLYAQRRLEPLTASADTQPSTPRIRMDLNLPRLKLPEDLRDSLALRDRSAGSVAAPAPPPPAATVAPAALGPDPAPATPATITHTSALGPPANAIAQPRQALLDGHFDLMREFLDNQSRVMARLVGDASPPVAHRQVESTVVHRWPMLGDAVTVTPQGLRCERRLDLQHERFLRDHTLGGTVSIANPDLLALSVVPFTFTMELIAEAAHRLFDGALAVTGLRALRGYRWLTLDAEYIDLRLVAERLDTAAEDGRTRVLVRVWQSNVKSPAGGALVFEGEVLLGPSGATRPTPIALEQSTLRPSAIADADLYTTGMFHGPSLRGVRHLMRWSEQGIEAELEVLPIDGFFDFASAPILATDAGLLDAAGQLVGYWLSEQFGSDFNCFPFRVASFEQYATPLTDALAPGARLTCRGQIEFTTDTQIRACFDSMDAAGSLIARLEGWEDRYFRIPQRFYEIRLHPASATLSEPLELPCADTLARRVSAFPEHFLDDGWAIWKRVLAHLVLGADERRTWLALERSEQGRSDWLLGRIAAKDAVREWARRHRGMELAPADIEIHRNSLGKPMLSVPALAADHLDVSIAHSQGQVVAAVADHGAGVGIDIEILGGVRSHDLVRASFNESEKALLNAHRGIDQQHTALCIWCAKEAAAKAAGTGFEGDPRRWSVVAMDIAAGTAKVSDDRRQYTVALHLGEEEILAVARGPDPAAMAVTASMTREAS